VAAASTPVPKADTPAGDEEAVEPRQPVAVPIESAGAVDTGVASEADAAVATLAREPTPVSVGVGDDLDRLVGDWPEIVKSVSPATRAVLSECRPIAVDGNVVTLGFPEAKGFLKDHAERRRQDVETAVGGHLGRPVSVRAVATNIEVAPLAGEDLVAEARRIFGEDLVEVAEID
jgi:hypothetical protein